MQPEKITQLIESGLKESAAEAFVEGDGSHFQAIVISRAFSGQSRIKRQQLVYDTVKAELLDGSLHALSIKTFTPEEWQKLDESDT